MLPQDDGEGPGPANDAVSGHPVAVQQEWPVTPLVGDAVGLSKCLRHQRLIAAVIHNDVVNGHWSATFTIQFEADVCGFTRSAVLDPADAASAVDVLLVIWDCSYKQRPCTQCLQRTAVGAADIAVCNCAAAVRQRRGSGVCLQC